MPWKNRKIKIKKTYLTFEEYDIIEEIDSEDLKKPKKEDGDTEIQPMRHIRQ